MLYPRYLGTNVQRRVYNPDPPCWLSIIVTCHSPSPLLLNKRSSHPLTLYPKPNHQHKHFTTMSDMGRQSLGKYTSMCALIIASTLEHLEDDILTCSSSLPLQVTRPPPPSSPTPRNRTSSRPPTTSREPSTPSPRKFSDRSKYFGSRLAAHIPILTEYSANVHSAVQPQEEKSTTQKIGDAVSGTSPLLRSIPLFTFTYSAYHPSS